MSFIAYHQFNKDFITHKLLGKGNCAEVYLIQKIDTGQYFALKQIHYQDFSDYGQCTSEIQIIRSLNDDAIPKLYHYFTRNTISNGHKVMEFGMIIEYCQKSLEVLIQEIKKGVTKKLCQQELWNFMKTMIQIFSKMQRQQILHRDIKPGNILIKQEKGKNFYKACDFGYSVKKSVYSAEVITGTEKYVSPRVHKKFKNPDVKIDAITQKDDVYSLGKTILQLMTQKDAINEDINAKMFERLKRQYDPNYIYILQHMLEYNQKDRWDFVRVEKEITKIQKNKKAFIIDLDNSMIQEDQEETFKRSLRVNLSPNCINSTQRQTQSRHIEVQTDTIVELTKKKDCLKFSKHNINETTYFENENLKEFLEEKETLYVRQKSINFHNEIYCMSVVDNYVVLGMKNSLGIIPLNDKQKHVYVLKLQVSSTEINHPFKVLKIKQIQTNLVFIINSQVFLYCLTNTFLKQIQDIKENHHKLIWDNQVTETRKTLNSCHGNMLFNTECFRVFEKKFSHVGILPSQNSQVSCVEFAEEFNGSEDAVVLGHNNGKISIFNKGVIYQDEESIREIKVFGNNKLVFSTGGTKIKMLQFQEQLSQQQPQYSLIQRDIQFEIIHFRITQQKQEHIDDDEEAISSFIEIYTSDGRKIILGSRLELIEFKLLERNSQLNIVCETMTEWSIVKKYHNSKADFQVSKHSLTQQQHHYYITSTGVLKNTNDKKTLYNFSLEQPCGMYINADTIVVANFDGEVRVLDVVTQKEREYEKELEKSKKTADKKRKLLKLNSGYPWIERSQKGYYSLSQDKTKQQSCVNKLEEKYYKSDEHIYKNKWRVN